MSMQDYKKGCDLIELSGRGDFEGPKPESLVSMAEAALGVRFPPSYRAFLREMGCGDIRGFEVFGLVDERFETGTVPNGIWLTLNQRRHWGLDPAFIIIGEGGDGTYYAIDTNRPDTSGEAPVIRLSGDGEAQEDVAQTFGEYFLKSTSEILRSTAP